MTYPGGKGKCYQRLINLMPPHSTYIESHLGGGAVMRAKRPAGTNIGVDLDDRVISSWRQTEPDHCTLIHGDAVTFLQEYPFAGGELVYSDPPYLPSTRRNSKIYRCEYTHSDHERLLDVLEKLPCLVMLSGYDHPLYNRRLRGWRKASFSAKTHADVRQECVWMNFDPPTALHDPSHLGHTYRERQTVRRRHQRLLDRFGRMDPIEREHLFQLLDVRYRGVVQP